jgi:hypothetical protein
MDGTASLANRDFVILTWIPPVANIDRKNRPVKLLRKEGTGLIKPLALGN